MSNIVQNGTFSTGIAGWDSGVIPSLGGLIEPQWVSGEGHEERGCAFLPAGSYLRQSVILPAEGRYTLSLSCKTIEPTGAPGNLYLRLTMATAGGEQHERRVSLPFSTTEWGDEALEVDVPSSAMGMAFVEISTDNLRSGVFVDDIALVRITIDACAPHVADLAARRDDLLFMKHAQARYREILTQAINEAPKGLWPTETVSISLQEGVNSYGLYHLEGLYERQQVEHVWLKYETGQADEISGWECFSTGAGLFLWLDEQVVEDGLIYLQYRKKPEYSCNDAGDIPVDTDWAKAHAMTLLLSEVGNDVMPEGRRMTDLQIWEGRKMTLEAQRTARPNPGVVRTMPSRWYAMPRPSGGTAEMEPAAPPVARFTASPVVGGRPLEVNFVNMSSGAITSHSWDFGDGQVSDEVNPVHVYNQNGTFFPTLTVTGPGGSSSSIQVIKVGVPIAAFHVADDERSGTRPHTVYFINDTNEEGIDNITYKWTFNVGEALPYTSTAKNPSHTYEKSGVYTVQLEVVGPTDSSRRVRENYITVTEPEKVPYAELTVTPNPAETNSIVTLSARIYWADAGWTWYIEDPDADGGQVRYDNVLTVPYTWQTAGSYNITIVLNTTGGQTVTQVFEDAVTLITYADPIADFYASKTTVLVGETVWFINSSLNFGADPDSVTWDWDFGDGVGTSSDYEPSYAFTAEGSYDITLGMDYGGKQDERVKLAYIEVQAGEPPPSGRVSGAIATYYFNEVGGSVVEDHESSPLDLNLVGAYSRNTEYNYVQFSGGYAVSGAAAAKVINAIKTSGAFSWDAWIQPLSADPNDSVVRRILVLGDASDNFCVEVSQRANTWRVTILDSNGTRLLQTDADPTSGAPPIQAGKIYYVCLYASANKNFWALRINTADGQGKYEITPGDFSVWDNTDSLALANRLAEDRPWNGRIYLTGIYDFEFTDPLYLQNFEAGYGQSPEPPPETLKASFTANPQSGYAPLNVVFTDTSEGNPVQWLWSFGNKNETSTARNPTYQYTDVGQYTVTLIVYNAEGQSSTTTKTITVSQESGPGDDDAITVITLPFPRTATYTTTKWVNDSTGSDSYPGTQAQPWKTLEKAGASAQPGDVVLVAAGTYTKGLVVANSGTSTTPIVFIGDGNPGDVVIDMATESEAINISDRQWVLVQNFEVNWDSGFDSSPIDATDARYCTLRLVSSDTGLTAQQSYDQQSNASRGLKTNGSEHCWYDQIFIGGMQIGMGTGSGGGYNYFSYVHIKNSGKHNVAWGDTGVSGDRYTDEDYAYNCLFYRCWFDYVWREDNVGFVADTATRDVKSYHWTRVIFRQCVFFGSAENALDNKDSRYILADQCMFYGGVGSDGRGEDFDQWAPTWTVGTGDFAQYLTMRRSVLWDNTVGPRTLWEGFVAAHNTMIHLNRSLNGADDTAMASGRIVGYYGFGPKERGNDQSMVNNLVWDQKGVEAAWTDRNDSNIYIDGNAYGENSGGDGIKWALINDSANSWTSTTSLSTWRSFLSGNGILGADSNALLLSSDPFKDVPDWIDYEVDGTHVTGGHDFRPNESAEVVGAAAPVTKTTNSGGSTSTVVNVLNPYPFNDGWGIMVPDYIRIAGKERVKVVKVDYPNKRITIENPGITWASGDRVDYDYPNTYGPTIGALQPNSEKWWEQVT